ncbi:MAG TPA: DNA repair protein RecN [Gammaproteobacteria bacterium]|nr:DNA repair protein RecN [Chromatiales bacterium]MDP7661524.1 DNA repair protein RecN [Gammaproteobacteria bacterium]HJP38469.1 DNA repair protein RecN [Gammaproteobacteria bacterium]
MLARLHISNLAVIDELELEFTPGMTTLTGETGAGKSILVDALALALGERADSRAVRTNTKRCTVTATFDLGARADITAWLIAHDLDADDECILRRIVASDGRSRGYVNGNSVPMLTLREIGEQLVDICGQQAHQSLRHPNIQRQILDEFGEHEKQLAQMAASFDRWQALGEEFKTLNIAREDRAARLDLLSYQVSELKTLDISDGEFAELERDHLCAANADRIATAIGLAVARLYETDDGSAHEAIAVTRQELSELASFDDQLSPITDMLGEAEILLTETTESLRRHSEQLQHDPASLQLLEQRLGDMHELARKHRVTVSELPDLTLKLTSELETLKGSDERLDGLAAELADAEQAMHAMANDLSKARHKTARMIDTQVTNHMQELGMTGGRFHVQVKTLPADRIGRTGSNNIEFTVTTNPGQAAGAMARIASGGELSRISLALQVVAMQKNATPTLIFDEVDSGVSGGVAEIVGTRLHELADSRQVLCVTHLPQVASQAGTHLRVTKITDGQSTRTAVKPLTATERIEEIARMLGGVRITKRTRAHAEEMLG